MIMNERIKQLGLQCRIEKYNQFGNLIEFGFDEEKFAQLIVEECIAKLSGLVIVTNDVVFEKDAAYEQWNLALGHAELEIREHFGVEE